MEARMANEQIDLMKLFSQVTKTVKKNQTNLNQADDYNHDHGDNMVEIFEVITQAMKAKKNAPPADQLEYAAQLLRGKSQSGSASLYANGLEQAAKQVLGKNVDAGTVITILQSLMGGGTVSKKAANESDMISALLGQLSGAGSGQSGQGIDLGSLVSAGMGYMAAKQGGKSDLEALTGVLLSGTQMAETPHRAQSGELVTSTLLKSLSGMLAK
jgi:hypothetical protein